MGFPRCAVSAMVRDGKRWFGRMGCNVVWVTLLRYAVAGFRGMEPNEFRLLFFVDLGGGYFSERGSDFGMGSLSAAHRPPTR